MAFDFTQWELRDLRDFCKLTGRKVSAFDAGFDPEPDDLIGIYWITKRHEDPEFTLEMAERAQVGELSALMDSLVGEADPPDEASTETASSEAGSPPLRIGTRGARRTRSGI